MSVKKYLDKTILKKICLILLLALPIIVYCYPILQSGSSFPSGDFDMQVQMTEAAKISIMDYGQFPFWNPWVSGGIPLFADPQFGLFTPQMFFAFFFTSVYAWKLTFLLYLLVGFFSMKKLLSFFGAKSYLSIPLAYLWVFNSFFILRFNGGHFTFLLLLLMPLAIFLMMTFNQTRWRPVQMTALLAFMMYAALHYSTILTILLLGVIAVVMAVFVVIRYLANSRHRKDRGKWRKILEMEDVRRIIFLLVTVAAALMVAAPRVWLTLHYLHDNAPDRTQAWENFIGIGDGLRALFSPFGSYTMPSATYGPFEASNHIGILTGIVIVTATILVIKQVRKSDKPLKSYAAQQKVFFTISTVLLTTFVVGLGGQLFHYLQLFPIFSSMRVSTRYLLITALMLLLIIGFVVSRIRNKTVRVSLASLLIISTIHVGATSFTQVSAEWVGNRHHDTTSFSNGGSFPVVTPPKSEKLWNADNKKGNYRLTAATREHRAQLITDTALLETRAIGTLRCDEDDKGCKYVLSNNANVIYWSPNKIILKRTSGGSIVLNSNPASGWAANGVPIFNHLDIVTSKKSFTLQDEAVQTTLMYLPY